MRYLTLALLCEGPTDLTFLRRIAYREIIDQVYNLSEFVVEIQEDVFYLAAKSNEDRISAICEYRDFVDLFLVHADATRNSRARIQDSIIEPIREGIRKYCELDRGRLIPLIPIREMEAWALADRHSIAIACGFQGWPAGKPMSWSEHLAEEIDDPKRMLSEIIHHLSGESASKISSSIHIYLEQIANRIDISKLRLLKSYQSFSKNITEALRHLRIVRA